MINDVNFPYSVLVEMSFYTHPHTHNTVKVI